MAESDNAETIRQCYMQLMSEGRLEDAATVKLLPRFFDPDVRVQQMSAMSGTAGDFRGYAGVLESVREVVLEFADPVFVPEEIKAVGEHVAAAVSFSATGRRSGVPVEYRAGHLFTLRNGLVTRFDVFESPAEAFRAAGPMASDEPATRAPGS
jgi:ketosteroid isomerase-like protein